MFVLLLYLQPITLQSSELW